MTDRTETTQLSYPRDWAWPDGAPLALSIGLAFESFEYKSQYSHYSEPGKKDHFSLSYADYGWKAGVWRLLDLLDGYGLKVSMSTNGRAAEDHPNVVQAATAAGHEIVGHGWVNDILMQDDDIETEIAEIRRVTAALTDAGGVRPVGWVSPGSTGSSNTFDILKAEGSLWHGDDASDDLPFLTETEHGPIVSMPRINIPANDLIQWIFPTNPPDIMWNSFKPTFDELYAEGVGGRPKWIEMTLHCHMAGRPTLIPAIRQCLDYARGHDGVWFARKCDIAQWALDRETV